MEVCHCPIAAFFSFFAYKHQFLLKRIDEMKFFCYTTYIQGVYFMDSDSDADCNRQTIIFFNTIQRIRIQTRKHIQHVLFLFKKARC